MSSNKKKVTHNVQHKETEISSKEPYESQAQLVLVRNEICSVVTAAPRSSLARTQLSGGEVPVCLPCDFIGFRS